MTEPEDNAQDGSAAVAGDEEASAGLRAFLAAALAWLIPGAGHFFLGKRARALGLGAIVVACAVIGCYLEGRLDSMQDNDPLSIIATLASMGSGVVYLLLRLGIDYQGSIVAAGYEYGTTFLRTAGILNLLLVLDAFDIARGRKD